MELAVQRPVNENFTGIAGLLLILAGSILPKLDNHGPAYRIS